MTESERELMNYSSACSRHAGKLKYWSPLLRREQTIRNNPTDKLQSRTQENQTTQRSFSTLSPNPQHPPASKSTRCCWRWQRDGPGEREATLVPEKRAWRWLTEARMRSRRQGPRQRGHTTTPRQTLTKIVKVLCWPKIRPRQIEKILRFRGVISPVYSFLTTSSPNPVCPGTADCRKCPDAARGVEWISHSDWLAELMMSLLPGKYISPVNAVHIYFSKKNGSLVRARNSWNLAARRVEWKKLRCLQ